MKKPTDKEARDAAWRKAIKKTPPSRPAYAASWFLAGWDAAMKAERHTKPKGRK